MEMCFGGTDELQRFLLYLTKSPLSPYHNVSRTNNQLVHHILKAIVNNNSNPGNIQVYYIVLYLLGISVIGRTLGSDTLFTRNMRLVDVKTAIPVLLDSLVTKNFASITLVSLATLKNEKINVYGEVLLIIEKYLV